MQNPETSASTPTTCQTGGVLGLAQCLPPSLNYSLIKFLSGHTPLPDLPMHCDWVFPYFNFFKTRSLPFFQLRCISGYESNLAGMLLLLLSRFSRVRLYATPQMAAHQAPPSLGFSRQEHWSRLPFPSPMQESEKWKWSRSVMSDSSRLHGLQPTRLLHPRDFPGKNTGVGCHCLLH